MFAGDSGGFLNTTVNLDTTDNKAEAKVRRQQNVVPLVIKQIENFGNEDFKLFGMSVHIIKLVGILRSFDVQTTKANYVIEDYTGQIKAVLWLENGDNGENATNLPNVKEDSYVCVYGSLRYQDDEKKLMVLRMFPVVDCNVITTHLLEVIYTRLVAEADSKEIHTSIQANNPDAKLVNSMSFLNDSNAVAISGLSNLQDKVLKLLSTDNTVNGMSRSTVLNSFPPNQHRLVNLLLEVIHCTEVAVQPYELVTLVKRNPNKQEFTDKFSIKIVKI